MNATLRRGLALLIALAATAGHAHGQRCPGDGADVGYHVSLHSCPKEKNAQSTTSPESAQPAKPPQAGVAPRARRPTPYQTPPATAPVLPEAQRREFDERQRQLEQERLRLEQQRQASEDALWSSRQRYEADQAQMQLRQRQLMWEQQRQMNDAAAVAGQQAQNNAERMQLQVRQQQLQWEQERLRIEQQNAQREIELQRMLQPLPAIRP